MLSVLNSSSIIDLIQNFNRQNVVSIVVGWWAAATTTTLERKPSKGIEWKKEQQSSPQHQAYCGIFEREAKQNEK